MHVNILLALRFSITQLKRPPLDDIHLGLQRIEKLVKLSRKVEAKDILDMCIFASNLKINM